MGWTFMPKPASPKAYLDQQLTHGANRVLRSAFVGTTYYAAVETTADGKRDVWAAVILTSYRGRDGYPFGYKCMDESMGPNESNCPATIFALLTPTDSEYSNEWRARVTRNRDRQTCIKLMAKPGFKVRYGGHVYQLDQRSTKPRGWRVTRQGDLRTFVMRDAQLRASSPA